MKLLTVAIPCYNSAEYMSHAIDTLLSGGEELEIIIVNDGSTDDTQKIAEEYQEKYPNIIRVIKQENGGHGEAVNTGLANASGLYFKVVDSDDWVNEKALVQVMEVLKSLIEDGKSPDLFLANYVYEKVDAKKKKVINYHRALPENQIFTWNDIMHFRQSQNILMHSTIYRTKLLKSCGIKLPKHTFYVDNIFVYQPLPYVKTLYYMDVNLYRYFIGRADQSVNEQIMIKRIDQQLRITKIMIESHNLMQIKSKKLQAQIIDKDSIMERATELIKKEMDFEAKIKLATSEMKKSGVSLEEAIEKMSSEITTLDKDIINLQDDALKAAKEQEKTLKQAILSKLKKNTSIDQLKMHGSNFEEVLQSVKIKQLIEARGDIAGSVFKSVKKWGGIGLALTTLPFSCGLLNWAYPRLMEKFMPEVANAKKAKGGK